MRARVQMGDKTLVFRKPDDNFSLAQIIATVGDITPPFRRLCNVSHTRVHV